VSERVVWVQGGFLPTWYGVVSRELPVLDEVRQPGKDAVLALTDHREKE